MKEFHLHIYMADEDGNPSAIALTSKDVEALFEKWLIRWNDSNPMYAGVTDTKAYGVESAAHFVSLAQEVSKEKWEVTHEA